MSRLIDADKLKAHYAWWKGGSREMTMDEAKSDFDTIIDLQPTVEAEPIEVRAAYEQKAYNKGYAEGYAMCLMDFDKVEPTKHGRWVAYEFGDEHWHKCSVCGKADEYINNLGLEAVRNYCPNCGALMDGMDGGEK